MPHKELCVYCVRVNVANHINVKKKFFIVLVLFKTGADIILLPRGACLQLPLLVGYNLLDIID